MRYLFCGSRHSFDWDALEREIKKLDRRKDVVIQGEAPGADTAAKTLALKRGIPVMGFSAAWDFYKKAAGPIRNRWMLKHGEPDRVRAFPKNRKKEHSGTWDMVAAARKAGVKVKVFVGSRRTK